MWHVTIPVDSSGRIQSQRYVSMPKLVDHEKRRLEIAQATWVTIKALGLENLTLRDIAIKAGFTTGVFSHYFKNKNSVLRYSFNIAYRNAYDRIIKANEDIPDGFMRIRNALVELLPDGRRPESIAFVSLCFGIRNSKDPLLAKEYKIKMDEYRELLKLYILDVLNKDEIHIQKMPDEIIDLFTAVLDGLCIEALLNPKTYTKKRCIRTIENMIEELSYKPNTNSASR